MNIFKSMLVEVFMPPGIWILIMIIGLLVLNRRLRFGKAIIFFGIVMMWLTSTTFFATSLYQALNPIMKWPEPVEVFRLADSSKIPQAIVVLGAGRRQDPSFLEYGQQNLKVNAIERLRLAAKLAKRTKLPILVTGGITNQKTTQGKEYAEAEIMSWVLASEFGLQATWLENQAMNTDENAAYSAAILKTEAITDIYLVTHATHMPRARKSFEKYGINVISVPVFFNAEPDMNVRNFFPNQISETRQIWHELIGYIVGYMKFY